MGPAEPVFRARWSPRGRWGTGQNMALTPTFPCARAGSRFHAAVAARRGMNTRNRLARGGGRRIAAPLGWLPGQSRQSIGAPEGWCGRRPVDTLLQCQGDNLWRRCECSWRKVICRHVEATRPGSRGKQDLTEWGWSRDSVSFPGSNGRGAERGRSAIAGKDSASGCRSIDVAYRPRRRGDDWHALSR